ncbi:MAG: YigZ family protein [Alphaproteobacteria bacterium]|nr:YigZ family protein [Alphaproteobacteria bacterium]
MKTLSAPVEHWIEPIKGSRFVGLAAPVSDAEQASLLVDEARARWPDASHHCWAYRLADGEGRSSDAGEPGGSAGRPILAQIDGHALMDCCVVVARWFGGTKLGVGGLIRAYGGCAGKTLDRGELVEHVPTRRLQLRHGYPDTGAVQAVLAGFGLEPSAQDYGAEVQVTLEVPEAQAPSLLAALRDATAGRARLEE